MWVRSVNRQSCYLKLRFHARSNKNSLALNPHRCVFCDRFSSESPEMPMTDEDARAETIKIFGEDSFTEDDEYGGSICYFVGPLPSQPGPYTGFMGFTWEEALRLAKEAQII